ncbi:MAG: gamma-glutamyl-gamma-aminobutyrate hydrolase family protein [Candidatus Latescibacterota bacterium]|nr:gamma-glutamyl-gamma-aminobutyrate hydrolase family protein [Candidatus Latescibacterota bacterium]
MSDRSEAPAPLIGLPTYGRDSRGNFSLPALYCEAVSRAGGVPVLLPPMPESPAECIVESLDGLILTGGGDIAPQRYEGTQHHTTYAVDDDRDDGEMVLLHAALDDSVPVLCICRGIQMLNVALGGSLVPHLPDQVGDGTAHRVPLRHPSWHDVKVDANSRLARIMSVDSSFCASWHHQAVDRLGDGLRVTARAADGTIEALELTEPEPWLIAVQWHPELDAESRPEHQALFDAHVEVSRRRAERFTFVDEGV